MGNSKCAGVPDEGGRAGNSAGRAPGRTSAALDPNCRAKTRGRLTASEQGNLAECGRRHQGIVSFCEDREGYWTGDMSCEQVTDITGCFDRSYPHLRPILEAGHLAGHVRKREGRSVHIVDDENPKNHRGERRAENAQRSVELLTAHRYRRFAESTRDRCRVYAAPGGAEAEARLRTLDRKTLRGFAMVERDARGKEGTQEIPPTWGWASEPSVKG